MAVLDADTGRPSVTVRKADGRPATWRARPSAAKGANLAVLEASLLARALADDLLHGDDQGLDAYSARCLTYIWRAQEFSHWMIGLLHGPTGTDGSALLHNSLRRSRLTSLRTSRSQQDWFAEHYVGV
ncbi:FAD-dependent monooxygenase [Streptomyces ossamyceticus]